MTTGFTEHIALLEALSAGAPEAAMEAVRAGSQVIYEKSQETVPVARGILKGSGRVVDPQVVNGTVVGGVSYGGPQTVTEWNGVGYEVFVEFGTSKQTATHFLTEATMASIPELREVMGSTFQVRVTAIAKGSAL